MNQKIYRIPKYVAWFYPRRIWYGAEGKVYLTFDDGPHPEITPWLLDFLKEQKIRVNFFWSGMNTEKYPELVLRAKEEGHIVGHHGYEHVAGSKLSWEEFKNNFDRSAALAPDAYFRPPYGSLKSKQAQYVLERGKLIMWSWMAYDFDQTLTNETILLNVKKYVKSCDIIVFHENDKTVERMKEIIPTFIHIIQKKGLTFDTIDKI
ncbi:MAG: polysaccharide deacetylase family protein [Brumimicrobium sp.]|nr:polysaccharide deacetylase family protein [Brumimicrobium sp.]